MKRTLTREQLRQLLIERRAQRMCNRDRKAARQYRAVYMALSRGSDAIAIAQKQKELDL